MIHFFADAPYDFTITHASQYEIRPGERVRPTDLPTEKCVNIVKYEIDSLISRVIKSTPGTWPAIRPFSWFITREDDGNVVPDDVLFELRYRISNTKDRKRFDEARKTGEIVFNDGTFVRTSAEQIPQLQTKVNGYQYWVYVDETTLEAYGYEVLRDPFAGSMVKLNGYYYKFLGCVYRADNVEASMVQQLPQQELERICARVVSQSLGGSPPSELLQEVLEKADSGYVDLFTSVAEAPEALKSAISGLKTGVRLLKAFKRRQIGITERFITAGDRLKFKYISREIEYEMFIRDYKKLKKDAAQAATDVWLNYRYNIMPLIYTLDGLGRALEVKSSEFRRWRAWKPTNVDSNLPWIDGDTSYTIKRKTRALIKGSIKVDGDFDQWKSVLLVNLPLTAWELVPYSFVADWFIPIGDWLTKLAPIHRLNEASMWSHRSNGQFTIMVPVADGSSSVPVRVKYDNYKATVYNARQETPFPLLGDGFNLFRVIDSFALSWNKIRGKF